jgi:hypothetical protein
MPKLLDQVRLVLRTRHYSIRTEQAYVSWIRDFILFHSKRHPSEMGAPHVSAWLSHLAIERRVAASTQNQALSAILFLYREVLGVDFDRLEGVERAKRPSRRQCCRNRFSAIIRPSAHPILPRNQTLEAEQVPVQVASLRADSHPPMRSVVLSLPAFLP